MASSKSNKKVINKKTNDANTNLSAFEQEMLECYKKVREYKIACEANVVSSLWHDIDLYYTYDSLNLKSFTENSWKVYWQIGHDIIVKEKKQALDDITVGLYLEKHLKLKEQYEKYNGYETIENAKAYVKTANIDAYVKELHKWNLVLDLAKRKFPIADRIKDFADMSSEEIYDEYEAILNHVFSNIEGDDISYDITDDLYGLIDKLDEGLAVGLPYECSPILTKETGGDLFGNITLVGGLSGVGKTALSRVLKLPSVINHNEKIVIMINEEGKEKWQREYLVWIANNILKEDLQKYVVRDGKYKSQIKELLYKCADWANEHKNIIIQLPKQLNV
jgi:replicative DNA helicase